MKYQNPVIRGFYPDPSICRVNEDYYLVTSSFEYFPGVPVFHSTDLVNWEQIGHCLTRKSQLNMEKAKCSHGIFAPTIRYHEGTFYMITTQISTNETGMYTRNIIVTTNNPAKDWSDPIELEIKGIDPSLFWEDGKTYVQYAGGIGKDSYICQVEIDIHTGKNLSESQILSYGFCGRDVEGPHLYKRNGWYYLLAAEGGTREGHMVTVGRSKNIWGPYEAYSQNPILTNRDVKTGIENVGHADLVEDVEGNLWFVALGVRPVDHKHTLGRETLLVPAKYTVDNWFVSRDGYVDMEVEVYESLGVQKSNKLEQLDKFEEGIIPSYYTTLRKPIADKIYMSEKTGCLTIAGSNISLEDEDAPSFIGRRIEEYEFKIETKLVFEPEGEQEAGLSIIGDNSHHMDFFVTKRDGKKVVIVRKKIDDIEVESKYMEVEDEVTLMITGDKKNYHFYLKEKDEKLIKIDSTAIAHLATECISSAFTGTVGGMYVVGENTASFQYYLYQNL